MLIPHIVCLRKPFLMPKSAIIFMFEKTTAVFLISIIIIAIIQFIQIPHMVWNADLYLQTGVISRLHPALDWLLYGVDLIEIVSIINVAMIMFSLAKKRRNERRNKKIKQS